jgi:hypothetical protein
MVQFGLNSGPCHLRVFQHVNNILVRKRCTEAEILKLNTDFLGVASFTWNLFRQNMPAEVVTEQEEALINAGLPPISTDDIHEGIVH